MAMVIIGGTGTVFGPIIGAMLILLLPAGLSYLPYLPPTEIGSIQQIDLRPRDGAADDLSPVGGLWGSRSSQGPGERRAMSEDGEILLEATRRQDASAA